MYNFIQQTELFKHREWIAVSNHGKKQSVGFYSFYSSVARIYSSNPLRQRRMIFNGYMECGIFLGKILIHNHVECGSIADTCHVFEKMPERDDASSWNRLISGYIKIGDLENARQSFDKMATRNVVSWTALISGYEHHGRNEEGLRLFSQMVYSGVMPNQYTFPSTLNSCANIFALHQGKQVHGFIIKTGFETNVFVGSSLVGLYAKCRSLGDARQVFDKMPDRNVVSWNIMMGGYAKNQLVEETLKLFCKMQKEDMKQDSAVLVTALVACGSLAALVHGKMVHAQVIRAGFYTNSFVGNAMVDMYVKCRNMRDAHQMFDKMSERDAVSWTAMIGGYVQNGYSEEALKLFQELKWTDVKPDPFTFASIVSACANLALLELGKHFHAHIIGTGCESSPSAASSLVTMYSKCGSIDDAAQVFEGITCKDLTSWNAMITGYAHNGNGKKALELFQLMLEAGMKPDQITFLGILTACSHAGLVDEGRHYFDVMRREYNILVSTNHYACMIDLLGRAGNMWDVEDTINNMPIEPDAMVWKALLGACRNHGNVEMGERAAEHLLKLEPRNTLSYALLSNAYAAGNRWKDVAKVRKIMKDRGLKTQPGCSWIQVKNMVYTFVAEDTLRHCQRNCMQSYRDWLAR